MENFTFINQNIKNFNIEFAYPIITYPNRKICDFIYAGDYLSEIHKINIEHLKYSEKLQAYIYNKKSIWNWS